MRALFLQQELNVRLVRARLLRSSIQVVPKLIVAELCKLALLNPVHLILLIPFGDSPSLFLVMPSVEPASPFDRHCNSI